MHSSMSRGTQMKSQPFIIAALNDSRRDGHG